MVLGSQSTPNHHAPPAAERSAPTERETAMTDTVYIDRPRKCDMAPCENTATYDGRTIMGPWANMCDRHFAEFGDGLGTGRGQRMIVGTKPEVSEEQRLTQITAAIEAGDFETVEELVGDGDIAQYL